MYERSGLHISLFEASSILTSFPPISQKHLHIHLILKNNSIKIFNSKKYLENITLLDLSNNSINSITPAAIENLQKKISLDLSNNELKTFPR
jgi:Leucine-rich repeat (LRR) protein